MLLSLVLSISTVITSVMASAQSDNCKTSCSPFRLLVIWHTSNGEDSAFIEQKRLIIRLIFSIPQGTEIQVTAINTQSYQLLHFLKTTTMDWIYNISMYNPEILENHTIQESLINETVFSFRKQKDKKEVAELFAFVVSEKTLIEKELETTKNIKICVVFTGLNPPQSLCTYLATDRQHLVMLNMTSESIEANINGVADTVLDLLCRDSRSICDTDEFWTGKRCVSCSYICSADKKKHPHICPDLCPDYSELSLKITNNERVENVTGKSGKPENNQIFIVISPLLALLALTSVAVVVLYVKYKKLMQKSTEHSEREKTKSGDFPKLRRGKRVKNSTRDPSSKCIEREAVTFI